MESLLQAMLDTLGRQTGGAYRAVGAEWIGPCPVCQPDGRGRHLNLRAGERASVVLKCQRGCSYREIVEQGGLGDLRAARRESLMSPSPAEITYDYTDAAGHLLLQVVRRGRGRGKKIIQRLPVPSGGWQYQLKGYKPPLYHAHLLAKAAPGALVALTEGEADADRLTALGLLSTTSVMGTSAWEAGYTAQLAGLRVAIFPDMDAPGLKLARQRLADCRAAGLAAAIVWLPFAVTVDHGQDISDWIEQGQDRAAVEARIAAAFAGDLAEPELPAAERAPARFPFLSEAQLLAKPPPEWQVENLFERGELVVIYGLTGCGKTFLASDIALSITQGKEWCGRRVTAGRVLFVNADGGEGFGKRVRAWRALNGAAGSERHTICDAPVNLFEPGETAAFADQLEGEYALVVIDTLSQCAAGADEVSTRDMGLISDGLNRLRRRSGAALLLLHHSTKDGASPRGVMTLCNSAATVIQVTKPERTVLVKCEKQRNWERFGPLEFSLRPVGDSCVLLAHGSPSRSSLKEMTKEELLGLVLARPGRTAADLQGESGLPQSTLYRLVTELVREGWLTVESLPGEPARGAFPTVKALRGA